MRKVREMTPARFDVLYAIRNATWWESPLGAYFYSMRQDALRQALGLHPSTISKMVKKLIEIGWVEKERAREDGRTFSVRLTEEGLRAIEKASRIIFRQRVHLLHFELLFKKHWRGIHVLEAIDRFWWFLRNIGQSFGDISRLRYNFGCPDD